MIGSASPRILQGACSNCSPRRAAHSTTDGVQSLRVKGACPMRPQLSPGGMKVSSMSQE